MKVHFFNRIDSPNRTPFYNYSTYQNLRVVKILSLIYIIVSLAIRLLVVLADLPIENIQNIDEFSQGNWISLGVTPFFYFSSAYLLKHYKENNRTRKIARLLSLAFAVFIMLSFMRTTFFTMHNPRNTLVMYLIGIIAVAVFFTFEYLETIAIALITGICFSLLLPLYQSGAGEIIMNNFASAILLTVFFCISRYSFSYRADNYLKLKAIEQKNLEIELAIRAKNEILGIVAHDLRNPLSAIKTVAAIMKMENKMDSEDHENLKMIEASCDKAANIINDLLEMAHDEQQQDFDTEKIELNQFLLKIVDDWVKSRQGQSNILYYGTNQPVFAYLNTEKMERVMDNLISNAIKFSGSNNHVDIVLRTDEDEVFIDIKDSGVGIPEDMLPFIFERFSRASRRGVRGEESVGLGLSIVRQIITKHGGNIKVSSIEKQGTTFTISLIRVS
ncbi:sensor histidine kinase [Mucilaginibacter auburnensis]|uniref:histidine kinase n=1 Tax=Mucilaginibacter auburnensis TaxID=1457233 RepID=A0A2H9VN98_9SPHI|nr:HAMP domain-containing sensor histidine kinase [Mucilaginibacter auburnensis]PJJ79804.1 signal transduction histidine kinase [Mucilaginibacter auburnensis]